MFHLTFLDASSIRTSSILALDRLFLAANLSNNSSALSDNEKDVLFFAITFGYVVTMH